MARDGVSEVFSVNQHASICGGFGPCPDTAYAYSQWDAKRRNSVTGAAGLQAATVSSVSSQLQSAQGDLPTMRLQEEEVLQQRSCLDRTQQVR